MAFASAQKKEGKTDLAEFIINRGTKVVNEIITNAWHMENAEETMRQKEKSRTEILNDAFESQCSCKNEGEWETCALETLYNDIPPLQFSTYAKELLPKGRSKHRNLMLTGPTNCGKTFLLNPGLGLRMLKSYL
jgi:predicted ATPase with chaperone activity